MYQAVTLPVIAGRCLVVSRSTILLRRAKREGAAAARLNDDGPPPCPCLGARAVTSPALDKTRCACGRSTRLQSSSQAIDLCERAGLHALIRTRASRAGTLAFVGSLFGSLFWSCVVSLWWLPCILDRWGGGLLTSSSRRVQQQEQQRPQQPQQQQIASGPRAARAADRRRAMVQASGLAAVVLLVVVWVGSLSLQVHITHRRDVQSTLRSLYQFTMRCLLPIVPGLHA